ncbi:Brevis radix [Sesbania bispinosa]|nr:Brevis radix [Sesbania bispinosa]
MGGDMTPGWTEPIAAAQDGLGEEDEAIEWVAQVESGVQITFKTIPTGGYVLKRIRFNREMFDRQQAQAWWGDNCDRIMELYNVHSFNQNAISTSQRFEDEQRGSSPVAAWLNSTARTHYYQSSASRINLDSISGGENLNEGGPSNEAARISNSSIRETEFNNGTDNDSEWVEQDQPGVLITIRVLPDGTKEIHRVSGQIFDEEGANQWWEENREMIKADYL